MKRVDNIFIFDSDEDWFDERYYFSSMRNASMAFKRLPEGNYEVVKYRYGPPITDILTERQVSDLIFKKEE